MVVTMATGIHTGSVRSQRSILIQKLNESVWVIVVKHSHLVCLYFLTNN